MRAKQTMGLRRHGGTRDGRSTPTGRLLVSYEPPPLNLKREQRPTLRPRSSTSAKPILFRGHPCEIVGRTEARTPIGSPGRSIHPDGVRACGTLRRENRWNRRPCRSRRNSGSWISSVQGTFWYALLHNLVTDVVGGRGGWLHC